MTPPPPAFDGLDAPLRRAQSLASSAAHGAASVVKTELLRIDRLSDADYEARLEVCRACPGNHATFRRDGSLATCGPMLRGMAEAHQNGDGPRPCGCVLSKKARDAAESCPFGYWPSVEDVAAATSAPRDTPHPAPALTPALVVAPVASGDAWRVAFSGGGGGSGAMGRRSFLARSLSALAAASAAGAAPRGAGATDTDPNDCYIELEPCPGGPGGGPQKYVRCLDVQGWFVGDAFKSDGACYELATATPTTGAPPSDVLTVGAKTTCNACGSTSGPDTGSSSSDPGSSSSDDSSSSDRECGHACGCCVSSDTKIAAGSASTTNYYMDGCDGAVTGTETFTVTWEELTFNGSFWTGRGTTQVSPCCNLVAGTVRFSCSLDVQTGRIYYSAQLIGDNGESGPDMDGSIQQWWIDPTQVDPCDYVLNELDDYTDPCLQIWETDVTFRFVNNQCEPDDCA